MKTNPIQKINTETRRYEGVEHLMVQPHAPAARASEEQASFFEIAELKDAFPKVALVPNAIDTTTIRQKLETGELSRYAAIASHVFFSSYRDGDKEVRFTRKDLEIAAADLWTDLPANLGDLIYSQRRREGLSDLIRSTAPDRFDWQLETTGRGRYRFVLVSDARITFTDDCRIVTVPDQTSPALRACCLSESARLELAIRENNLLERFLAMPLARIQGKTRTFLEGIGQTEIDGILMSAEDLTEPIIVTLQVVSSPEPFRPAQAMLGAQVAAAKYPNMCHQPVIAQALNEHDIVLFEVGLDQRELKVIQNVVYRIVHNDD
ncbi:hypothetical protein [Aliiruegeria sabulilitoris]|uniref:hypothetical protein n=1 Tax=Aliiruegeria sabulilitoris TaxID=1510458 RepID=UPI00082A8C83|nr:hypothetical protein [Aliiruegeria sabulilitoris]NDR56310.1 hypothetical protein [Pseudoruegeria sp. M32A2M]